MNSLRPLLFLSTRSIVNGLRRALTSPRRLLVFTITILYYFFFFIRPSMGRSGAAAFPASFQRLHFPALAVVEAFVFGIFCVLSLTMMLGLLSHQGGFRPPDVDVLFPTPISPKYVLAFKMARDYLITFLFPFFLALMGLVVARPGWQMIFRDMPHPEYSNLTLRAMTFSWLLMSLGWVSLSYATSLFANRSDRKGDRRKTIVTTTVALFIAGSIAYVGLSIYGMSGNPAGGLLEISKSPVLRTAFFSASFATLLTMAPLHASWIPAIEGMAALFGVIAIGIALTLRQIGWMYDQAAARGFKTSRTREMQRSGDMMGLLAEKARSGKFRKAKRNWVHKLRMQGILGLVWKEMILQPRVSAFLFWLFLVMEVGLSAFPVMAGMKDAAAAATGPFIAAMQGFVLFQCALVLGQSGFTEVLKRIDMQKPLPFSPLAIVLSEVIGRAIIPTVLTIVGCIVGTIVDPSAWDIELGTLILAPFLSLMLCAISFCAIMFFPDFEDPSQRPLRGIVTLLGLIICGFFPVGSFIGLLAIHLPGFLAGIVGALLALAIGLALCLVSGAIYANFNPSE